MTKRILFLFIYFTYVVAFAQNEKIVVTDLTKIRQIAGISFAPDSKKAVYSVTAIEPDPDNKDEYKYISQLYLADFQNNAIVLTQGSESSRQPIWSPDGKTLAFVRNIKGKAQIFVLPVSGGEAYQLTKSKYNVSNPVFSPDGKKLLFTVNMSFSELLKDTLFNPGKQAPAWSLEKPGFPKNEHIKTKSAAKPNPDGNIEEIRAYLEKDVEDKKAKVINRLNFQGEATTEPEINFTHLAVIDIASPENIKPLTKSFYSFGQAGFTPDGKIIYTANGGEEEKHPDRQQENRIFTMNMDGTNYKPLLSEKGKRFSTPAFSSDGKYLAFQVTVSEGLNSGKIFLMNTGDKTTTEIVFDRSAGKLAFSTDNQFIYFTAPSNGGQPLYRYNLKTKKIEQLTDYNVGISDFDIAKDKILFTKIEVANPSELYSGNLSLKTTERLTDFNYKWIKNKKLSYPEKRTFTNEKGQVIEYWIMKPTFVENGKKYPLLLQMHGGPTAMWGPGEQSMWHEFQFFCAKGYGIVYANPRGSGGYGHDFLKANYQDWGTGPAADVLRACSEAAQETWADTSRQVITGGSYAGYLTAWIVAHDNRFKAAFAQRGVYELSTFMGEANAWRLVPNYFGGYPWQASIQKVLDENSPYTFVDKIKTPLLIKHGENDLRTGVSQSEMLYKSMKIMGKEVEYVRMPGATHELSRSGNVRQRIDRILRIYEFMERYIGQ
jgi:dipeptidyl aminopeptidase/acylaminoacyl peptidase